MSYTASQLEAIATGDKYFPQSELGVIQNCSNANRLGQLAEDPDHAGRISGKSLHEAVVGLAVEGKPGGPKPPIVRDPMRGRGEFIDADRKIWDVKGERSCYPGTSQQIPPSEGGFEVNTAVKKIEKELNKGENVIVDTTTLTSQDKAQLEKAIAQKIAQEKQSGVQPSKWQGRIVWYP
jgi:hypothetical protein